MRWFVALHEVRTVPATLVVQLKRFSGVDEATVKNEDDVKFDATVDLGELSGHLEGQTATLCAVIEHVGGNHCPAYF